MTASTALRPSWPQRVGRTGVSTALASAGVVVMLAHGAVRTAEAKIGAAVTGLTTGTRTVVVDSTHAFFWSSGTVDMWGLRVTPQCTAAFIAGPVLVVAGFVAWSPRLALRRVVLATAVSVMLIVAMIGVRLGLIAWATYRLGPDVGYRWSHTIGGSLVSILGVVAALVAFVVVAFRGVRGRHRT